MNKLLFTLERDWDDPIILVANNHKDLEDYLRTNYDWYSIEVKEDHVNIKTRLGYETEVAQLKWVKHI